MLKFLMKSEQVGVTLLETILVLSLVSIIMVGGLKLYGSASDAEMFQRASREVIALKANIRGLYSRQNNFSGLTNNLIIDSGLVPGGTFFEASSGSIKNAYGGSISVKPSGLDDKNFEIYFGNIDKNFCIKTIASADFDFERVNIIDEESVSNSVDVDVAVGLCNESESGYIKFICAK